MCTESHLHFDYVRLAWDSGFCFEEYKTKTAFDISVLSLVDVEKVCKERDIATVEKHIPTILQFKLDEDLAKILEPTFVKIFRLCQLSIQYLRFCKKYLDNTVIILKKDLSKAKNEISDLHSHIEELQFENATLHKQYDELKSTFQKVSFKCEECPKVFYNEEFLQAHVKRRHESNEIQTESDKLQLEIKELKQRLNNTEKHIQNEKNSEKDVQEPNNDVVFAQESIQTKFEQLQAHIKKELSVLRDETFFRNIYEKWFSEILLKIESDKKNCVEQATGENIQFVESYTQTQFESSTQTQFESVDEGTTITPIISPTKLGTEELEEKLKLDAALQREQLEHLIDQKLNDSFVRLESQMSTFWHKMNSWELKREQEVNKKPPQATPRLSQTRYITTGVNTSQQFESNDNLATANAIHALEDVLKEIPSESKSLNVQSAPINVASLQSDYSVSSTPTKSISAPIPSRVSSINSSLSKVNSKLETYEPIMIRSSDQIIKCITSEKFVASKDTVEDSESEESTESSVQIKPSNSSTLAKRSVTSLRQLMDDDLLDDLKKELQEILNLRLKEMGIASQWNGLPEKTYNHALGIVTHQASLSQKSLTGFSKIRQDIIKCLEQETSGSFQEQRKCKVRTNLSLKGRKPKLKSKENLDKTFSESSDVTVSSKTTNEDIEVIKAASESFLAPSRSMLKSSQENPLLNNKKKVLFDLDSEGSDDTVSDQHLGITNTSSLRFLNLDGDKGDTNESKLDLEEKKSRDIFSWDTIDIS